MGGGDDVHVIGEGDGSQGLRYFTFSDDVGVVGLVDLTEEGVEKLVPFQRCYSTALP
jgi:hypothetical protein